MQALKCLSMTNSAFRNLPGGWLLKIKPFLQRALFLPGHALIDAGEAMRELGEVKDALDMEVKQNFIDPLQNLHEKDLKEIQVRAQFR